MSEQTLLDPLMDKLKIEKDGANKLQQRKHSDWNDNYELYRLKVKTNRLTQRQAICIPLMKETIKTALSKIDEAPNIDWKELGGDEDKEILFQEIWDSGFTDNKLELVDILDKKNVLLYGLSTKKLNITDTGVKIETLDVYDIVFDPLMKVGDIETARYIVQQNIFRSVREVLADKRYTAEGKNKLKIWAESPAGVTQGEENKKAFEDKMQRLLDMGVNHSDFPLYAGGDRIINLTEHYTTIWNEKKEAWERRVIVYADNSVILLDELLVDLIGVDFYPLGMWVEDPETADIYSDSIADIVRVPNQIINVWWSQLIENRSLKNFQMHWYSPSKGYTPQTYTPGQGVMLPAPPGDDINKVIKPVEISGLDDTLPAIAALTAIVERGTGTTAIDKGTTEKGTQTLGEIEILVGKSTERALGMAKFYRMAWYEIAWKWEELMEKNAPKILTLYKTGRSGTIYIKKALAKDWTSELGYKATVNSSSEQEQNDISTIQKWGFIQKQHPDNQVLKTLALKRELELLDLTPEELKEIEEAEKPKAPAPIMNQPKNPMTTEPAQQTNPEDEALLKGISSSLNELQV